jgi:hypothetical protein
MARRSAPVHPRGEIIPDKEPRRVSGRTIAVLGGIVVLTTTLAAAALFSRGGGESDNATSIGKGDVPATASPFPDMSETPRPSISQTPEATATTKPTPQDVHYGDRRNAAERYDRCDVAGFTNNGTQNGRTRLNLNLVFENDPTSTEVRSSGESKNLHWDNPVVIAAPLDANGVPTGKNILTFPAKTDAVESNTPIFMPRHTATDTKYAIGVVTNAITPYGGGDMETKTVTYCDTIVNEGDEHWNKLVDEPAVPPITSVDIYHD